ncbi:hypothetical protein GXW76_03170 [Roseomonas soli]|uniref:Uncharacterized protein n=2 Tax=Neoroseomonas soli TaxID=1081025 RepID=A0A9X9WSN5_9PROT|nr:hypothetical protein [Neoroseomonas soli]
MAAGWRHRWKAMAAIWLVALLGWSGVRMLPNQYLSTARIYADADAILGLLLRGIAIDSSPAAQVEMLQRTLLSRPNLERLIDRSDLSRRVAEGVDREQMLQRLQRDVRFYTQSRNLFAIEYRDRDPVFAQNVVQTVVNLFLEAASGSDRRQMENARTFLLQQLSAYEVQLREAERRRADFTTRYQDLLSLNGSVSRLEAVRARREALRGELEDTIARRDLIREQIDAAPRMAPVATQGGAASEAERRLAELRQRYTDQHPDVIAARAAAAAARGNGGRGATAAARSNPLREQLTVRLVDVDAQIASLERQIRDIDQESERLEDMARSAPEVQAQFANLDRDYNVIRRNYEELLARRESVNIADAARTSTERVTLEVVDPPTMPTGPAGPNRLLLSAGVLLLALGAGGALVVLLVQFDGSFYTLKELRRLGLPVIGGFSTPAPRVRANEAMLLAGSFGLLVIAFLAAAYGGLSIIARLQA